jgi:hypothetical protein
MRNGSEKVVEKINTNILCSIIFYPKKSCRFWHVEKRGRAGQATVDNMMHAHCQLDTKDYKYTLKICNTFCFCTGKLVARMRLNVTLYKLCLPCALVVMSESFYRNPIGLIQRGMLVRTETFSEGYKIIFFRTAMLAGTYSWDRRFSRRYDK